MSILKVRKEEVIQEISFKLCVYVMLQHVRNRRLHLRFVPSRRLRIDRDLFLNLGRVQNLSVEVDHNPEEDGGGKVGFDPLNLGRIAAVLELLILFCHKRYLDIKSHVYIRLFVCLNILGDVIIGSAFCMHKGHLI